ncbi:hypothetical protein AK812_SmicGene45934, partial [Symbiodinium microadriaticum]
MTPGPKDGTPRREFVNQKEGSALRAWCKHFDPDNDQKISQSQFLR